MKIGYFTPKPGDLFQWHSDSDNSMLCEKELYVWSKANDCEVPLYGINLLISITDVEMYWYHNGSLVNVRLDDVSWISPKTIQTTV